MYTMSIISRERALCMLHCAPFTKENVKKYAQVIERSENLEICYMENPMEPMITSNFKINGCPFRFHRYPSETVLVPTNETKKTESEEAVKAVIRPTTATKPNTVKKDAAKKRAEEKNTTIPENIEKGTTGKVDRALLLINHAQVAEFLNVVYLTQYPRNPELYDFKKVKSEEILDLVRFYTYLFDKKSVKGLVRWFARASVNIYNAELCRDNVLYSTEKRLSYSRELYVMKKEFIIYALKEVVATIPTYPKLVNNFKEEDCCIVGYLKLPKRFYNTELFLKALGNMCSKLRSKLLVDRIFVSKSDKSSRYSDSQMNELYVVKYLQLEGNTDDMLQFIRNKKKVCLVTLANRSSLIDWEKIQWLTKNYQNISQIIINEPKNSNAVAIYDSQKSWDDFELLEI